MTPARGLLALLLWLARHLVALGFLAFLVVGWVWREPIFAGGFDWPGLAAVFRSGGTVTVAAPPRADIPRGAFRPAIPGLRSPVPQAEPENLLARARKAYWLSDYAEAERLYRRHVAEYPGDVDGHGELGNLLLNIGRTGEARTAYLTAIGLLEDRQRMAEAARLRAGVEKLQASGSGVAAAE